MMSRFPRIATTVKSLGRLSILVGLATLAGGGFRVNAQTTDVVLPLGADEQIRVDFPAGFLFPFFGQSYAEVWVGADGFLAFGGPELNSAPPSELGFLTGPPRVASLFADLDPSAGGSVSVRTLERSVRVRWQDVPRQGVDGLVSFSATLFDTGDVWIDFDEVSPVEDDLRQGLSGVTPGGVQLPDSTDLSEEGRAILLQDSPVYELFLGAEFDLAQGLFFQATRTHLIFPLYDEEGDTFAGFAFTNVGPLPAGVGFVVRQDDGTQLPAAANPTLAVLDEGTQLARLGTELIGSSVLTEDRGWAQVNSSSDQVAAFFLQGEIGPAGIERLDGALAQAAIADSYCFTRVYQGTQVFPSFAGPQDASTTLFIANPGVDEAAIRLRLFSPLAQQLAQADRIVPGRGRLRGDINELFREDSLNNGYVCVEHLSGETAGLELIRLPDAIMVLAGRSPGEATQLFSAQLAHSQDVFTSLKLVNPADEPQALTLTAFLQDSHGLVSTRVTRLVLPPGQAFQKPVDQIFALGPGGAETIVGSIQVESEPGGVLGDVIFGDPQSVAFAAALPLQETAFTQAVFSHVANGPSNPENPSFDPFTGLAIFNPNDTAVSLQLEVFDPDGALIGCAEIQLGPRQRLSELVELLVPETVEMSAGFARLTASVPVVAQQIFGNGSLQFFSAIPAQVIH